MQEVCTILFDILVALHCSLCKKTMTPFFHVHLRSVVVTLLLCLRLPFRHRYRSRSFFPKSAVHHDTHPQQESTTLFKASNNCLCLVLESSTLSSYSYSYTWFTSQYIRRIIRPNPLKLLHHNTINFIFTIKISI